MEWLKKYHNLLLVQGILFILLGIAAVCLPVISTLSTELFIGWLLIIGGCMQAYHTYKAWGSSNFWIALLLTCVYLGAGISLILHPLIGIFSLTVLLILFLFVEGTFKLFWGIQLRAHKRSSLLMLNGILAIAMAVLIWIGWPNSALWVIGLLVGINLIFLGASLIFLSSGLRKLQ